MPIKYNVSQNGLRIETIPEGVLDIQTTIEYFREIDKDSRIERGAIEIVNFNKVTDFKFSALELEKITQSYQIPKVHKNILATIFYCEHDLGYGIGRMLHAYHYIANPNHKVFVVRTESELENKIKELSSC